MKTPHIFAPSQLDSIHTHYSEKGFVVVQVLDSKDTSLLIQEQLDEIIAKQPWKDKINLTPKHTHLDPKTRKLAEKAWPFHIGFGACCDPQVFHLPRVWEIRQNKAIYKIASRLAGSPKLWVDINRSIHKLPTKGENEFLHWDCNPYTLDASNPNSVCGKVCYTPSRYVCVPGAHTPEFFQEFTEKYSDIYPNTRNPKFGLDPSKPDPMNLFGKKTTFKIPAGCLVFWNSYLLHGVEQSKPTDPIEYGCYLGYFPAGSRPEYQAKTGVTELEDRLDSYYNNTLPKLWPSFDIIHYYPYRFQNFPHILQKYIDRIDPGSPYKPTITTRTTAKGKIVPHLLPPTNPNPPPQLSSLGRKLLGLDSY